MSSYRTISSTDLRGIDKVNFTVRSIDPSLPLANSPDWFVLSDPRSSQTSLASFEESSDYDSNPPTLIELNSGLPGLFARRNASNKKKLHQWLQRELFFAQNLILLPQVFHGDESAKVVVSPRLPDMVSSEQYSEITTKLTAINTTIKLLTNRITSSQKTLSDSYATIIQQLKLTILTNFRSYKNFENSRAMFETLTELKTLFDTTMNDDLSDSIHGIINDLLDEIYDYNSMVESISPSSGTKSTKPLVEICNLINFSLSEHSLLMSKECWVFNKILEEVCLGFAEYIDLFNDYSFSHDYDVFKYEIVSFDDHLKSNRLFNSSSDIFSLGL